MRLHEIICAIVTDNDCVTNWICVCCVACGLAAQEDLQIYQYGKAAAFQLSRNSETRGE